MTITLALTWTVRCDKRGCHKNMKISDETQDFARHVARKAGWEILSEMSVRCPDHIRHPELLIGE